MTKCSSCDGEAQYIIYSLAQIWEFACREHENQYARMFGEDMIDEFNLPIENSDLEIMVELLNRNQKAIDVIIADLNKER